MEYIIVIKKVLTFNMNFLIILGGEYYLWNLGHMLG